MSELIWIAVPGGFADQRGMRVARLRVVIMPRLDGSSLASEGLAHWPPQALTTATLAVEFASAPDADVVPVDVNPPHIRGQDDVWEAFFGDRTIVRPRRSGGRAAPEVEVEKTSAHAELVDSTFRTCAQTEVSEASSEELSKTVRTQLATQWRDDPAAPASATAPTPPPPPDFHQTIAWLREHPAVLRALGLIFDLSVPTSAIPEDLAAGIVRVRWPGAPGTPEIVSPWSRYGREFFPGSTINISAGMVTLTDDRFPPPPAAERRWDLATVDVDGAAARLRSAARALAGPPESETEPDGDAVMLPALRTAGLMLLRRGRAEDFATRRAVSDANGRRASMADAVLTADDLTLGYRVDVSERGSTEWFSLQRREAKYEVGALTIGEPGAEEEGHLKAHAATAASNGTMRADEVVARWDGWSLAVPRPPFENGSRRGRRERRNDLPFAFQWVFKVPAGSVPPLLFGKRYRLRARVADLAGGGLRLNDAADDRCATAAVAFRRYEPIASPAVSLPAGVADSALGPAESVDVIVIRSDGGSVAEFAAEHPRYALHPRRVLSPPRASLATAERHDMLGSRSPERTFDLLKRAAARDGDADSVLPDPASGGIAAFPRIEPGVPPLAARADRNWSEVWPDFKPKQLELRDGAAGAGSPIAWLVDLVAGDLLAIKLAKAEQVTIEVSSFLEDDFFDQFAISTVPGLPSTSQELAEVGRHPMITPARLLTFVHAIRRPLKDPQGTLIPRREPGDTCVLLVPAPALLGVDANSTAQIDITARWPERRDDDRPAERITTPVQSVIVNRGDQALKDVLRQEFGDTRHRAVTYTVTAVSRFRQYFDDREDSASFLAETTLADTVMIPSTVRPSPPVVLAARPAFAWTEARESTGTTQVIRRTRLGGHVRLEIERPWYQTGDGERLAVIVSSDGRPSIEASAFMTQAGQDPIWDTSPLTRWPSRQMFAGTAGGFGDEAARLEELGVPVNVVTYEPWFHGDRWYVDIVMPGVAALSYSPLVQLAVGRYQPHSLVSPTPDLPLDLRLSRVVKTEIVPLLPERTLTIARSGAQVEVRLDGLGPSGPRQNRVDVILERTSLPPGVPASAIEFTSFDSDATDPIAWRAVPGQSGQSTLGTTLAVDVPAGTGPFRVRVREVELVGSADVVADPQHGALGELAERVIFTDTVFMPDA